MSKDLTRRQWLRASAIASLATLGGLQARAENKPINLDWDDLIPEDQRGIGMESLRLLGIVQHGQLQSPFDQETDAEVVTDYDGKIVRIPGYAVPLEFEGTAISTFILVPYVGACIHVPPPPPNQLIFVEPKVAFRNDDFWDPVYATGVISTTA
ncbi:MAG: DUF3299 domain-containing protein, partial [Pseudomonadota bacterium]